MRRNTSFTLAGCSTLHFLAQWSKTSWQFCLALFLAVVTYDESLIIVSWYGMVVGFAVTKTSGRVGQWIDTSPNSRLTLARWLERRSEESIASETPLRRRRNARIIRNAVVLALSNTQQSIKCESIASETPLCHRRNARSKRAHPSGVMLQFSFAAISLPHTTHNHPHLCMSSRWSGGANRSQAKRLCVVAEANQSQTKRLCVVAGMHAASAHHSKRCFGAEKHTTINQVQSISQGLQSQSQLSGHNRS